MYTEGISILQIDPISTCNARCLACYRQDDSGHTHPHFPRDVRLDLDVLEKALLDPRLSKLQRILMCGNYGDPIAHPDLIPMLDLITRIHPRLEICIHTNGGLGTTELWRNLGERFQANPRSIVFSIDGLADTNALYRRGVSWERVMSNAKTFINHGGRAIWKFVVFQHNKHQIAEAQALSEEMGFVRFRTTPNYAPWVNDFILKETQASAEPIEYPANELRKPAESFSQDSADFQIHCDSAENKILFLDFEGNIWPCCWIAGGKYSFHPQIRFSHQKAFPYEIGFNSLKSQSLSQALEHPYFKTDLEKSWEYENRNCSSSHPFCSEKCGRTDHQQKS